MMKAWVLLGLILILSACGTPEASTPLPTPQVVNLVYPPALQPWADQLSNCAVPDPNVALFLSASNGTASEIHSNDIILELGDSSQTGGANFLSQVGLEQIVVVVNQANSVAELTNDELRSIFSGQTSSWQNGSGEPIQVWVLAQGDPVRKLFNQAVMQNLPMTTQAMLAPDPTAMLEAISANANAIGFLPGSFLNASGVVDPGKINIVQLETTLKTRLSQPVVAATAGEPNRSLRRLLVCLESNNP
jgi:hypothetical protein